ncbi:MULTISPECIES: hypothetical protein [unclassified Herbaspirillum]|uniref:hypothetical protein n=1 Tax=unclassified Herbaspirillum TaxID=2624150 RepID=UPI0011546FC5|nr:MULTISPECIES: hypothetical protein [unclassified Herbaspirillum]MBB5390916.1 hypothetical protein [Herbaspirillum sp. SJZ102]TQK06440.1 hypothetical protein FB599_2594 [Herbaspirillum sp. SJZ130]TQK12082.1 hypothetical protein FB598_2025 [Herbaspirillum sp. SJZ106]
MMTAHEALTLQMLEWIQARPHLYADVLEVWRTTCPRLSIWEDACADGLIECPQGYAGPVAVSAKGRTLLSASRLGKACLAR